MELVTGTATVEDVDEFVAALSSVGDRHDCAVQAFDARYVADREHLRRAVELADRAIDRDAAIARDRAVELLLYAAGRRQIDRALEMGVDAGEGPVAVCVAADPGSGDPGDRERERERERERAAADAVRGLSSVDPGEVGLGDPDRLREFFAVGEAELAATDAGLPALVRERTALLVVDR